MMRELSLFTGAGGGLLGTMLLGWRCVGAVEFEEYPCKVLEQRQKDGALDDFPIWYMDIREFNRRVAPSYTGLVDVVTAGFPCQPHSIAGKQEGADDERNMWPETIDAIRIVKPWLCLLENVPGIISNGYIFTILDDLAEAGYKAFPPFRVGADDIGANHDRKRYWIVSFADTEISRLAQRVHRPAENYEKDKTQEKSRCNRPAGRFVFDGEWGERDWIVETGLCRKNDRCPARVDRLKALGNMQVPAVVAAVWWLLTEDNFQESLTVDLPELPELLQRLEPVDNGI